MMPVTTIIHINASSKTSRFTSNNTSRINNLLQNNIHRTGLIPNTNAHAHFNHYNQRHNTQTNYTIIILHSISWPIYLQPQPRTNHILPPTPLLSTPSLPHFIKPKSHTHTHKSTYPHAHSYLHSVSLSIIICTLKSYV